MTAPLTLATPLPFLPVPAWRFPSTKKIMLALVAQITPLVPLLGLLGITIVTTGAATYLVTNRIAGIELKEERRDKEREVKNKEREVKEAAAALVLQMKEAAAELERVRSLADLELKVEKASSANTNMVMQFLFRGDFSPMREALQAKLAKQAAASAASELAAAPADQVLK